MVSYADVVSGYDEPDIAWMNGAQLKVMCAKIGQEIPTEDSDGIPIEDGVVYQVGVGGIHRSLA